MAAKTKGTKAPAKRTAAKKTSPKSAPKKTTAKKSAPLKSVKGKTTAKKTTTKGRAVKNVPAPEKQEPSYRRIPSETTGFSVGTDQDIIAEALLAGGESREQIIADLYEQLDTETRNGTPKPISSLVSSVLRKLVERGFTVDQHFVVVPPVPKAARKRRAA
jgi:hypothetical protein